MANLELFIQHEVEARYGSNEDSPNYATQRNSLIADFEDKTTEEQDEICKAIRKCNNFWAAYKSAKSTCEEYAQEKSIDTEIKKPQPAISVLDPHIQRLKSLCNINLILQKSLRELREIHIRQESPTASQDWLQGRLAQAEQEYEDAETKMEDIAAIVQAHQPVEPVPLDPPVEGARKVLGHPHRGDGRIEKLATDFWNDKPDEEVRRHSGNWVPQQDLGGGIAKAGLWLLLDDNGIIRDRIVCKKAYMSRSQWISSDLWNGEPRNVSTRVPWEVHLQKQCAKASGTHFPRIRHWSQDHQRLILTIYVEDCSHRDLNMLHRYYRRKTNTSATAIPEAFLWFLFLRLVEACIIMKQGGLVRVNDWPGEIVHQDIKPLNVFLDEPDPGQFPNYPMPKLGDFGVAIQTSKDDPMNPILYNTGGGTRPFLAPEQLSYVNSETREPVDNWQLLDYTNVYGIGLLMFQMVMPRRIPPDSQPAFEFGDRDKWQFSQWTNDNFSEELLELINDSIHFVPSQRESLSGLNRRIWDRINRPDDEMAAYLRSAYQGTHLPNSAMNVWRAENKYAVGMALEDEKHKTPRADPDSMEWTHS